MTAANPVKVIGGVRTAEVNPWEHNDITREVMGDDGLMRVLPAEFWAGTTWQERTIFGHTHGLYGYPTTDTVQLLGDIINGAPAIEIGAGCGVLGKALGIPCTDSYQQAESDRQAQYAALGIPAVRYGPHVEKLNAYDAIRKYEPKFVVAQWVTQYSPGARYSNEGGVDEFDVLDNVRAYLFIGSWETHRQKAIMSRRHITEYPPFLFSRSHPDSRDFLAVWKGRKG